MAPPTTTSTTASPISATHWLLRLTLSLLALVPIRAYTSTNSATGPTMRPARAIRSRGWVARQSALGPTLSTRHAANLKSTSGTFGGSTAGSDTAIQSSSSSTDATFGSDSSKSSSSSSSLAFQLSRRLTGLDQPTVWQEFSPLAVQYGAVNLGQGFPDWEPPAFVIDSMRDSITVDRANQYARSYAHLPLATVLAEIYTHQWQQQQQQQQQVSIPTIDPVTQVATATGCTNVLYCALQGLLNPGDEVILFEPAFDIYSSQVRMAGGIPIYVPLRPSLVERIFDPTTEGPSASHVFTLDLNELQQAITHNTKAIILNTPHNPTGKMFSRTELVGIADLVRPFPSVTILADEVYEHIVFDPEQEPHVSMATILPDQTLTLSSAGKTFSATGWKVGWAVGPPHLVAAVTAVQQWVNFSAATPNQNAVARSLRQAQLPFTDPASPHIPYDTYYAYLAAEYKRKRGLLVDALHAAGMTPIVPPGGFFVMADTSGIDFPYERDYQHEVTAAMPAQPMPRDWALSRWLTQHVGVTAIPPSAFYSAPNIPLAANLLRFAFCKSDDTIREAHRRFQAYF